MDFATTKKEIIDRCVALKACRPELDRIIAADDLAVIGQVLKDNWKWAMEHELLTAESIVAWGLRTVGIHANEDVGAGCFGIAYGSATVTATDSATVTATDSATVRATGSATVTATGSATVRAYDSATVTATDSATVTATDSATVTATDSATVRATGSATVTATDSATVTAYGSAYVLTRSTIEVKLSDHAIARVGNSILSATDKSITF